MVPLMSQVHAWFNIRKHTLTTVCCTLEKRYIRSVYWLAQNCRPGYMGWAAPASSPSSPSSSSLASAAEDERTAAPRPAGRQEERLTNISPSIYYWLIIGFRSFIGTSVCSSGDAMTSRDIKLQQLLRFIIPSTILRRYDICSRSFKCVRTHSTCLGKKKLFVLIAFKHLIIGSKMKTSR